MARREESLEATGSQDSPDLPRHGGSPPSSQYRSSFELGCCDIALRQHLGLPPSLFSSEAGSPFPDGAELRTSTPLPLSPPLAWETLTSPDPDGCQPTDLPGPSLQESACSGAAPPTVGPPARPLEAAQRRTGQQPRGGDRSRRPFKVSLVQAGASGRIPLLPKARKTPVRPGTRYRYLGSRLQRPSGTSRLPQHSTIPKAAPQNASSGKGRADKTYVCVTSSFPRELLPVVSPHPGGGNAIPAEQVISLLCVGDQLYQHSEKNELEQIKSKLADCTARLEALEQMISSMRAQLRAAGIHLEDAGVEDRGARRP